MKVSEYEHLKTSLLREFENRTPDTASLSIRRRLDGLAIAATAQQPLFSDEINRARQSALDTLVLHATDDPRWKDIGDPELGEDLRWQANVSFLVGVLEATFSLEPDEPTIAGGRQLPMHGRAATPDERREQFTLLTNDDPHGVD